MIEFTTNRTRLLRLQHTMAKRVMKAAGLSLLEGSSTVSRVKRLGSYPFCFHFNVSNYYRGKLYYHSSIIKSVSKFVLVSGSVHCIS